MATIVFNGRTYSSLEEMPVNERETFEQISQMLVDKNGNGIPDFMEGDIARTVMAAHTGLFNFNGQTYRSIEDLPPDVRAKVQAAYQKLVQSGFIAKLMPETAQIQTPPIAQAPVMPKSEPLISREYAPVIQEDSSSNIRWVIIGLALLLCVGVAALAAFFFFAGK